MGLLLHTKVSLLVSGDNVERYFVSWDRIRGSHPENVCRDRSVDGEADVVERDSQRERETRRRIQRELASYAFATAEREKRKCSLDGGWKWLHVRGNRRIEGCQACRNPTNPHRRKSKEGGSTKS